MEDFIQNNFFHSYSLEEKLCFFIGVFFLIALILFLITILKRVLRLKNEKLQNQYQNTIDALLFEYLFFEDIKDTQLIQYKFPNTTFQKVLLKSIVSLHRNYSGEYRKKLEFIYVESKLVNYSLKKLESKNWGFKIDAIRDLSNLKYLPAIDKVKLCLTHKNELVQVEALIGILLMTGLDEFIEQRNSKVYLNDWVQSNIIFVIKNNNVKNTNNLKLLLTSDNVSFQLLGARLTKYYSDFSLLNQLKELELTTEDLKLKAEIGETIKHLTNLYN